jgi:hypothetical protein
MYLKAKNENNKKKYIPLYLQKFDECGWSVLAKNDITAHSYICEYSGNVLYVIFKLLSINRLFMQRLTHFRRQQMKLCFYHPLLLLRR